MDNVIKKNTSDGAEMKSPEEQTSNTAEDNGDVSSPIKAKVLKSTTIYEHIFKKPFTYEGKTYEKLTFDFEHLTGRDIIKTDEEMAASGKFAISPEVSRDFQQKLAARAAGVGSDVIEAMNAADFMRITNFARNFLLDMGF